MRKPRKNISAKALPSQKNTSVIVRRVPVLLQSSFATYGGYPTVPGGQQGDLSVAGRYTNTHRYNNNTGEGRRPPPGYMCHRCGQPGHFIQYCPTNGDPAFNKFKKSTGIPKVFLQTVTEPGRSGASEGALMLPGGGLAVMKPNSAEFDRLTNSLKVHKKNVVDKELLCPICKGMMKKAVVSSCCKENFCDGCIRRALFEDANSTCPVCKKVSPPEMLTPNMMIRKKVGKREELQGASAALADDAPPMLESAAPVASDSTENAQAPAEKIPPSESRSGSRGPSRSSDDRRSRPDRNSNSSRYEPYARPSGRPAA